MQAMASNSGGSRSAPGRLVDRGFVCLGPFKSGGLCSGALSCAGHYRNTVRDLWRNPGCRFTRSGRFRRGIWMESSRYARLDNGWSSPFPPHCYGSTGDPRDRAPRMVSDHLTPDRSRRGQLGLCGVVSLNSRLFWFQAADARSRADRDGSEVNSGGLLQTPRDSNAKEEGR